MSLADTEELTRLLREENHIAWKRLRDLLLEAGVSLDRYQLVDYEPISLHLDRGVLSPTKDGPRLAFSFDYRDMNFETARVTLEEID